MKSQNISTILSSFGISAKGASFYTNSQDGPAKKSSTIDVFSPIDNQHIGQISQANDLEIENAIQTAKNAQKEWQKIPAPKRGEFIRILGNKLRAHKENLASLVTYEMGKSYQEALGEVQEMIDICDFAVGLSRQLHGLSMHSERPKHRMYEQWHPLGVVGVISAFNFPVAVWCWNIALSTICGNTSIWKPSEKTPFTAIACLKIIQEASKVFELPEGAFVLLNGNHEVGAKICTDDRVTLISATGSSRMGKIVAQTVAQRLGKTLLELGGNNAMIISEHAQMDLAIQAAVFGCIGTAGQRCTSTRRLIIHESVYKDFSARMCAAYKQVKIGNPLNVANHMGPLIDNEAVQNYLKAIKSIEAAGGKILFGGEVVKGMPSENYVMPTIAEAQNHFNIVQEETFAPIVYLISYQNLEEAISIQNDVKQGLSSSIFTQNLQEAEQFLSASGSDCGIANVNIGTSGAEIGGAFGGEKETGGGRESGSDAWKFYMRRQTNTINFGSKLPLAQGIEFEL